MKAVRLHFAEWLALAIFFVLFLITTTWAWLYRNLWVLMVPIVLITLCTAVLIAVVKVWEIYRDEVLPTRTRTRGVTALAAAILLPCLSFASGFGSQIEASIYLMTHLDDMRAAERRNGSKEPAKIGFLEGIPDGGMAIIRWDKRPTELPQIDQVSLTGERIKGCRRIVPDAWVCHYD